MIYINIDYDNVIKNKESFRLIITSLIETVYNKINLVKIDVFVRLYGGWFEKSITSTSRIKAMADIQKYFKNIYKIKDKYIICRYQFADYIIKNQHNSDQYELTHTIVKRPCEKSIIISKNFTCNNPSCKIKDLSKWIYNKNACFEPSCKEKYFNAIERYEQKQVDTHLMIDTLLLSEKINNDDYICIASDDWDFIPIHIHLSYKMKDRYIIIRKEKTVMYSDDIITKNTSVLINMKKEK